MSAFDPKKKYEIAVLLFNKIINWRLLIMKN